MKRDLATVEAEIALTKQALQNAKGNTTEVYARIVGYYRSVRNWNKGKREEFDHRKLFTMEDSHCAPGTRQTVPAVEEKAMKQQVSAEPVRYELFVRTTCPNCPPVKAHAATLPIAGEIIDVDSEAGFSKASTLGVFSAPTVIFYDIHGREVLRAHSVYEMKHLFSQEAVGAIV